MPVEARVVSRRRDDDVVTQRDSRTVRFEFVYRTRMDNDMREDCHGRLDGMMQGESSHGDEERNKNMMKRQPSGIFVGLSVFPVLVTASGCQFPLDPVAKEAFWGGLGNTSVTVFPAFMRHGKEGSWDPSAAKKVGAFLADKNLAKVTLSDAQVPITGPWHHNEARMLKESAEAFAAYVKAHPVSTDFALLPEYLMLRSRPGGIHCYVTDAKGRVAYVVLQNSHWTEFQEVDPKSVDDCTEVLIRVFEDDLRPAKKDD